MVAKGLIIGPPVGGFLRLGRSPVLPSGQPDGSEPVGGFLGVSCGHGSVLMRKPEGRRRSFRDSRESPDTLRPHRVVLAALSQGPDPIRALFLPTADWAITAEKVEDIPHRGDSALGQVDDVAAARFRLDTRPISRRFF